MSVVENNKVTFAEPPADFDWAGIEDDKKTISAADREKMEKAYEDTLSSISEKEVLMGTVVGMNKKEVVINIGYKSEGVVPVSEFRYKPDLKIGDQVEVYIEKQEDKGGQMVVSHKTARVHNAWGKVNHAMETNEIAMRVSMSKLLAPGELLLLFTYMGQKSQSEDAQPSAELKFPYKPRKPR